MSFGFCPFAMSQHVLMTCYFLESANFMGMYIFALKSIRRIPYRRILFIYGRCLRSDSLVLASYARCKPGVLGVRKHCFGLFPSNRKPILALSNVGLILLVSLRGVRRGGISLITIVFSLENEALLLQNSQQFKPRLSMDKKETERCSLGVLKEWIKNGFVLDDDGPKHWGFTSRSSLQREGASDY